MKSLWSELEAVKDLIGNRVLALFFDFDGTLAPIASRPEDARLSRKTLDLLKVLSLEKSCRIAIVSGRALSDVKQKIGLDGIVYAGNHGLEIEGPGIHHAVPVGDTYLETLRTVKSELLARIEGYKGAFVEDKGLTLSVHFRLVELDGIIELGNKIRAALLPYNMKNLIKVRSGKMVFEIRPPMPWDKGLAVLWIIDKWRVMSGDDSVPLYCGDDATDEDAFRALNEKGVTIVVGEHEDSAAQYYLNNQEEVNDLLVDIIELKK